MTYGAGDIVPGTVVDLPTELAMLAFGQRLADALAPGQLIRLTGTLGAGKTTLVRGILQGLGHSGPVKSPTYTLLEPYDLPWGQVYHFDLYRISDPDELELIGFSELIGSAALSLVEWPARGGDQVPGTRSAAPDKRPDSAGAITAGDRNAMAGMSITIEITAKGRRLVFS